MFAYADMPCAYNVSLHRDERIDKFGKPGKVGSVIHHDRQRDRPDDAGATSRYASVEQGANSYGELVHRKMDRKRRICLLRHLRFFSMRFIRSSDGWPSTEQVHESE